MINEYKVQEKEFYELQKIQQSQQNKAIDKSMQLIFLDLLNQNVSSSN